MCISIFDKCTQNNRLLCVKVYLTNAHKTLDYYG